MMSKVFKLGWFVLVFLAAQPMLGPSARGQDALLRELIRKSEAAEPENGFCATTGWPPTDPNRNDAIRENAIVGTRSVDSHGGGARCSSLLVTDVFVRNGRKCVRWNYWVCERGSTCGGGKSLWCRRADKGWERIEE